MSLHVTAEVLMTKRIGAYQHLTLVAPGVGELFRPGTFLACSTGGSRLARRALWIHKVQPLGGYGAAVHLVVEPRGEGSRWLAARVKGDRFEVTGPLGRPFALPKEPVPTLLVGEGYASAALLPLVERLRDRGCSVSLLLGARDEQHLLAALEARRTAQAITVLTEDGSVGQRGRPTDQVAEVVRRTEVAVVYAAGPTDLLHTAALAAEEHGAWSQTAVEAPDLPCGIGLCHGCPVPVVGEDGAPRTVRACTDGPVIRGDRVRWDDLREGRP